MFSCFICKWYFTCSQWSGFATWGETILPKNFDMKDMGDASYVISIKIHKDRPRGILGLSQVSILTKF